MKKIIVVGSGFSGSIIARKIAEELNLEVIILEKRNHIAGNMYDELDQHNILVQKYGPHVLVTNEWQVISYLQRFSPMFQHTVKELSYLDDKYIRLPFNFESIQQIVGYEKSEHIINKLRNDFSGRDRVPIQELCHSNDKAISDFANLLFEKAYRTYCSKQWDIPTDDLDISIMGRSAIALSYDERYMNKDFQFLPLNGFASLFYKMLDHNNISIKLNCDALNGLKLNDENGKIYFEDEEIDLLVYTGAIDELFDVKHGELPYRSLEIKYEWYDLEKKYPEKIISYPQAEGYVRRTEYKYMMNDWSNTQGTTIATEYPIKYKKDSGITPYYPVITAETKEKYQLYLSEAKKFDNLFLCGRLAEFKYYNMDDCILKAFDVYEEIKKYILAMEGQKK